MTNPGKAHPEDRWAEALAWHSKLRLADTKGLNGTAICAWQDWYADAQNRRTFDDLSRLLAERALYGKRPRCSETELNQDEYDLSVPIAEWVSAHRSSDSSERHVSVGTWVWLSSALAIAATLALVVISPLRFTLIGHRAPSLYQTAVGGLQEVRLEDGSRITLGGQTRMLVAFSAERRSVNLIEGQAWFRVAHDARRPFTVTAGDGVIKDVGTAFLVTRESDRVIVTVTEGIVEVSAQPGMPSGSNPMFSAKPILSPIQIGHGEEIALSDGGALGGIKAADSRAAIAWIHGRLTFDDEPLRYVIETVDRYSSHPIVVSRDAGALRFSGIVFDNEIDDWLQSLKEIFPVSIESRGTAVRIKMRSAPSANRPQQ